MAGKILIHAISTNPYIAAMLLDEDLPETDWWHGTSWAEPDYATDYIVEHGEWWDEEALPMSFLSTIWASPEVQRTLKDFINTRRAIMKARSGEERVSLDRASEALWGTESIRKLASEICKTFGDSGLPR